MSMKSNPLRLLLLSNYPHFLADFQGRLNEEFKVERATSESMLLFLCTEWEPHLLIIDGDSTFFNSVAIARDKVNYQQMGILVFSKEITPPREEKALTAGCDMIMPVPSTYTNLLARVNSILRRLHKNANGSGTHQALTSDSQSTFREITLLNEVGLVKRNGVIVTASPLQFKLLQIFISNKEQLLSRQYIREHVWQNAPISPRSIDAHISKLKRLLPELEEHLLNIYGKGYIFTEARKQAA